MNKGRLQEEATPASDGEKLRSNVTRLTGCPCGCLPGERCLTEQPAPKPDACGNKCGALTVERREAYAKRHTCPCREVV